MVDPGLLQRRLALLEDFVRRLAALTDLDKPAYVDRRFEARYLVLVCAQLCVDMANQALAKGGPGNDTIYGGDGADELLGYDGRGDIFGGPGPDRLVDGRGTDAMRAGDGRDHARLYRGADMLYLGAGGDRVTVQADGYPDRVACGPGFDSVHLEGGSDRRDDFVGCEIFSIEAESHPAR